MLVVRHRVNTRAELGGVPIEQGVEIDLRCDDGVLRVRHDAVGGGEPLDHWLVGYRHALLVVNVKEEGLESLVLAALALAGVTAFFFLDQSVPFLVRTVRGGEGRCAVRVSELEGVTLAERLAGQARWIWLDCFLGGPPVGDDVVRRLRASGYGICLVSPELHDPARASEIPAMRAFAERTGIDAVCTKRGEGWG